VAEAQNYLTAGGTPTFAAPEPVELGFTDTANGGLHLEFPLGSFPQRGSKVPLTMKLMYDSNAQWYVGCAFGGGCAWYPNADGNDWTFFPPSPWLKVSSGEPIFFSIAGPFLCSERTIDATGTTRYYFTPGTCGGDGYATDSSGYRDVGSNVGVYAPDGTLVAPGGNGAVSGCPQTCAKDSNGNYILYGPVDTLGRTVVGNWQLCVSGTCQFNVLNSQGGTSPYTVTPATINVKTNFGQFGVTEYTGTIVVVQSIALPDGTAFTFKYDCDSTVSAQAQVCSSAGGQSGYYGLPTQVTLPTGGQSFYGWQTFADSYGNRARWLYTRQSAAGFWTYFPQVISTCSSTQVGCQQKMTVSKPGGASTAYTFTLNNGAWPGQIQSYDNSGNLLSTVNNTFDFSVACPFSGCYGAGYIRLLTSKTTVAVPAGASITKQTTYSYDSPHTGNVTAVKEWGYYSGTSPTFPSVPDRATYTSYLITGTNNINRPLAVTICNNSGSDSNCPGGGSKVSQALYTYDSYSSSACSSGLVSVTGVVNHDDTNFGSGYTQRGNPTLIQSWVSGSTYLATQYCYDATGQVLKAVDPAGNPTTYSYADNFFNETGASSMSSYTPPAPTNAYPKTITVGGLTTTFGYYFGSGRQAVFTDPNSITTSDFYSDPFDRPTQTVFPIGWSLANYTSATQSDTYAPAADTVASISCTSCRHNQVNLDTWGRKVNQKLVNAPGGAINVDTTYDSTGRVQSVTHAYVNTSDPSHVFETFAYDGADRRIAVTHPDNQSAQAFYGPLVNGPGGGGGLSTQQGSPFVYGYGYPVLSVDEAGKPRQQWLDGFGRIIEVDEPTTAQTPGTGSVTINGGEGTTIYFPCGVSSCPTTLYDQGTVSITVGGFTVSAGYGQGSTSSSVASSLASALNSSSSPVTATLSGSGIALVSKAVGGSTNYSLSATSSTSYPQYFSSPSFWTSASGSTLTGGSDAGPSFATPLVTLYTYDALDNLTQVIQGVQTRTFTYDGLGRRTSMTTPEAGTDNFYFTKSDNVTLCAGSHKAVCRRTDARAITTTYTFDSLNRLTGKTYSNGQGGVTIQYDQGGAKAFALGRLTNITDPSGSETITYDKAGRITQIQKVIGTTTYPIKYQYNAGGQITQITYPSGRAVTQSVDSIGRLLTVASGSTNYASIPSSNGYNAAGQILTFNYGNGVSANFSYSAVRQQMTNLSYAKGTQTLFSLNYYYQQDPTYCTSGTTGNDGLIDCVADSVDSGRSVSYAYDVLGRLSTAVTNGSSGYSKWGLAETFDQYGNRLSQSVTAGSAPSNSLSFGTTPPSNGAYTNHPDGYPFDASGNMLNDGNNTLTYDAENCLTSSANSTMGTSTYTCDAHRTRVKKALQGSTTTVYVFSGGKDIAEYDNGARVSKPSREYIYLGTQLIATIQGGTTTYYHGDHLSVRVSTDANGNKIGEQGHYPYGETWYASNTTTKFIFTSYERDSDSGNDYAMARFYISRFGRFSCVDPLLGRPGDPQSWNRYAYARNNPTNNVDPSGLGFFSFLVNFFKMLLSFLTGGRFGWSLPTTGTPPIFSDPLGNTQATLNSIYHPGGLSKFGINNFALSVYGPQQSPCQKFSESLADRLYNANQRLNSLDRLFDPEKGMRAEGGTMVAEAFLNVDEYGNSRDKRYGLVSVAGFKPELVTGDPSDPKHQLDQGQDVYHHILFFAGNTMMDNTGADLANAAAMAVDIRQMRGGRTESIAEFKDDLAGLSVGNAMVQTTRAGKSADYAGLARTIMDILCI